MIPEILFLICLLILLVVSIKSLKKISRQVKEGKESFLNRDPLRILIIAIAEVIFIVWMVIKLFVGE